MVYRKSKFEKDSQLRPKRSTKKLRGGDVGKLGFGQLTKLRAVYVVIPWEY